MYSEMYRGVGVFESVKGRSVNLKCKCVKRI